jgi:probable F420-dependent oxidoreductase
VIECRDLSALRIGAKLPNSGPLVGSRGIPEMARALEEAGFDSLWVSDHVVLPAEMGSRYPFAADGRATWPSDTPYSEALVALAMAAAVTQRVVLGTAVIVLPQRNPVLFAKQVGTIAVQAPGRVAIGVGAGWLAEEFAALDAPFAGRGARLEEWIAILRNCWRGETVAHEGERYTLAAGTFMLPAPADPIPLLMGGHAPAAIARAGRAADGWLGQQAFGELDAAEIADVLDRLRRAADEAGRDPEGMRAVLRIIGSAGNADALAPELRELAAAGIDEVIVDADWDAGDLARQCDVLRQASA